MIFGKTHIGLVRETNEDALFYDEEKKVMIIADGIGGHARGEEASNKAIESLRDYIFNNRSRYADKEKLLIDGFKAANTAVHHIQEGLAEGKICGTTLTCAIVDQGILYFAHVGDTRIYVSRDKKDIEQITYDHTYLSELARKDFKTFIEMQSTQISRANNYLTRAIGPDVTVEPQVGHFRLKPGDYIIMLTDGVYRYLNPLDILHTLKECTSIVQFTNMVLEIALEKGGKDNLSIIVGLFSEGRARS